MKTIVYWVGVILIGLSIWGAFIALWILIPITRMYIISKYSGSIFLSVGVIIFLYIGLRMMKEGREVTDQRY